MIIINSDVALFLNEIMTAMTEIEIKILEIDRDIIEKKLIGLGAYKVFDGEIHAIYYDFPDNGLRENRKTLRLRKEGLRTVLTLKVHVDNAAAKERNEYETETADFIIMQTILEGLGFIPWLEMKKHRTSFELQDAHFELDQYHAPYDFIPLFLEIEGKDTGTVYRNAAALGFTRQDCKPWDAVQLAAYYTGQK
jgi:adenylate cyclase class 2